MDLVNTRAMHLGRGVSALKWQAIGHNVASLSTPSCKALRVDFIGPVSGRPGRGVAASAGRTPPQDTWRRGRPSQWKVHAW